MRKYRAIIWSDSSNGREYIVTTSNALKVAEAYGRCEAGEVVEISTLCGRVVSRAAWTPEGGRYYRQTI